MRSCNGKHWTANIPKDGLPTTHYRREISLSHSENNNEIHTFSVYPYKGARRFPFGESVTLDKPCGGSITVSLQRDAVIFPRIRRRQPGLNGLLELVTCWTNSAFAVRRSAYGKNRHLELFMPIENCCMITGTHSDITLIFPLLVGKHT
jgi:hypothetical protein